MQFLRNLKIGVKFLGGFSLIILFLSYFSVNTYYKIENITIIENASQEKTTTAFYMAQKINDHLKWVNKLSNDVYNYKTITVELDPTKCSFGKWYYNYSTEDPKLLPLYKNLEEPHKNLHKHARNLLNMIQEEGSKDELLNYYSENLPDAVANIENAITEFSKQLQEDAVEAKEKNSAALLKLSSDTFYLTSFLIVVSIIITILMTVLISKPIKLISKVATKYTDGEKDITVNYNAKDEIGLLAKALNKMMKSTNIAIGESEEQKRNAETALEEATKVKNISLTQEKYLSESTKKILVEMEKFSTGDLTVELFAERDDDISKLFSGFNRAVKNIKNMILKVEDAVETTYSASTEISSQSDEMAAGTQQQSAQASEVAAAVEEMSNTILETTKNASLASEKSKRAGEIAKNGGIVVNQTVTGMIRIAEVVQQSAAIISELGSSSAEIGNIIQVIDDIADQTNLLALNAAIEAARAGEQGRGFAVVADEVRKLAERTTKATKEIADMIKKIQRDTTNAVESINLGKIEVEKGKELAQRAGVSLKEIIDGSDEVVDVINQVAAASEEQSSASEQISKSIDGINNVTHQTASGVQQIAKAADDLNRLTQNLQELISRFKIEENRTSHSNELSVRYN